jgi:hypothetical protein
MIPAKHHNKHEDLLGTGAVYRLQHHHESPIMKMRSNLLELHLRMVCLGGIMGRSERA